MPTAATPTPLKAYVAIQSRSFRPTPPAATPPPTRVRRLVEQVAVRTVRPSDAAAVAGIYAHHVAHGTASFDTDPRSAADTAAKIAECERHGWPFLVADRGGEVIGYAYATQFRDRPAY